VIFVTVGTQLPFDRLVGAADQFAARHPQLRFFAQIGAKGRPPAHMQFAAHVGASECAQRMREADLIIAHAGMGSVLSALGLRRPIIVMPRRHGLGEHRSDHQIATANWLRGRFGVHVAADEAELHTLLGERAGLAVGPGIEPDASPELIERVRHFLTR
jgi:UDP-N-acetylglucosamine transferase subunit ALG13